MFTNSCYCKLCRIFVVKMDLNEKLFCVFIEKLRVAVKDNIGLPFSGKMCGKLLWMVEKMIGPSY